MSRASDRRTAAAAALALALLGGCTGPQHVLDPYGPAADAIAGLGRVLFIGAAVVFAGVMALALYAILAPPERRRRLGGSGLIVGGGVVLPVVVLSALLVYAFLGTGALTRPAGPDALRLEVIGRQWWWEVHYLDQEGERTLTTANEIRIPVGRPIEIALGSPDVIHSFWVPNLGGKIDMIPGRTNRLRLEADRPGVFRGQCAEYCGLQHALMAFYVVALTAADFEAWFRHQEGPAPAPADDFVARGAELFLSQGCGTCHTVRGLEGPGGLRADGELGPDLTHVASRLSLAAGTLDNNVGNLAGWIVDAQSLKPGNVMPSFNQFDGVTLRAITAYVASLR